MTPSDRARILGAFIGALIAAALFGAVELAALEVHGCNAFGCDPERIR